MAKKKPAKTDEAEDDGPNAGSYTLRRDREQEFRRTINYESGVAAQLVFQPGVHVELTQEEVDGLENEIKVGMIVPSNRDDKGRQKLIREVTPEATATITKLEKQVEELSAENAQLKADLEAATAPK
jgi:hypothetical protein